MSLAVVGMFGPLVWREDTGEEPLVQTHVIGGIVGTERRKRMHCVGMKDCNRPNKGKGSTVQEQKEYNKWRDLRPTKGKLKFKT